MPPFFNMIHIADLILVWSLQNDWTIRNIPTFKDSCDAMGLSFLKKMADRLPKRPEFTVSRLSGKITKTSNEAYTSYLRVLCIGSHVTSASWNTSTFYRLFLLLKNAMWARFWPFFKEGDQLSILFCIHSSKLSYRLTFIMLNVGMVDIPWIPRSKTLVPPPSFT